MRCWHCWPSVCWSALVVADPPRGLWVAHEAWFADHLFYSPGEDYRYRFAEGVESLPVRLADGRLRVDGELREGDMLVLGIGVRAGWLGRFLEPSVLLEGGAEPMPRLSNVG